MQRNKDIRCQHDAHVNEGTLGQSQSYSGRIQQPHVEDIVGNCSTVVETLIQAMQYVHRKSHSLHLGLKEDGVYECWKRVNKGLGKMCFSVPKARTD